MPDNADKTILITGCSSGIGYCVARGLQQRGYRVFATARRADSVETLNAEGFESLQLDKGVLRNPSFVDYRIATAADVPTEIESLIVEVPQDDGPWGARGVGEHPMVPTIPAIANAIYNALGVRLSEPPFTAEKVYLTMLEAGIVA